MISNTISYLIGKKTEVIYSEPVTNNKIDGESEIYRNLASKTSLIS